LFDGRRNPSGKLGARGFRFDGLAPESEGSERFPMNLAGREDRRHLLSELLQLRDPSLFGEEPGQLEGHERSLVRRGLLEETGLGLDQKLLGPPRLPEPASDLRLDPKAPVAHPR
jgi:hypothetical protein